jgi:hypothetical protein
LDICECQQRSSLELESRKLEEQWQSKCGYRQIMGFLKKLYVKKAGELLSLNRNQLRIMTDLLTGHFYLTGCLFKLGLVNSSK